MQELGFTRSARCSDHLVQTPDTFVRAPLPGMRGATAIVHASPAIGAKFTQFTAEFEAGGTLAPADTQRFVYVLSGSLQAAPLTLLEGEYAWLAPGSKSGLLSPAGARAAVIEKPYQPLPGIEIPVSFKGCEQDHTPLPLLGDPDVEVRSLIPADQTFDLAVNVMTFQPGATLPMVEVHVMEHGLLMLSGGGIYRLGERWYPVREGDFIWMAPWLPQWFGALGKKPAKYLIYKDWNR